MPTARDPYRDPYRTLGLLPGASLVDVKRAYRRLAKANHPDTAGPSAMPRFLAIQAAYETLTGLRPGGAPDTAAGQPWRADPARARATREAWQSRAGRRPPSGAGAGSDRRAGGAGTGPAGAGAGTDADAAGDAAGARRRRSTGRARPGPGVNRPPNRATPGSTSYDFADHEFDPEWSGASWYGPSSGTYWTINPKEYADPRKHGPEYQARARRGAASGGAEGEGTPPTGQEPPTEPPASEPAEGRGAASPGAGPGAEGSGSSRSAESGGPETARPRARPWAPRGSGSGGPGPADQEAPAAPGVRPRFVPPTGEPGDGRPSRAASSAAGRPPPNSVEEALVASVFSAGFLRSRVALALFGWPPIGLGLAIALGELSGCSRFAAACVDSFALGLWVAQLAVIGVLLLVPGLAAIAAVGTLATLAAAVPSAVVLSAAGGSRDPSTAAAALAVFLTVAWVAGVVIGVARRSRTVPP